MILSTRCSSSLRWLVVLFLTVSSRVAVGGQAPTKLDSLKRALTTATDTNRVKLLHQILVQVADQSIEQAMAYAQQSSALSKRLGWLRGQAQAQDDIGRIYWRQGNFPLAQQHMLVALELWRTLHQEHRVLRATSFMVELLGKTKRYDEALQWEKRALAGALASHDTLSLAYAYMGFGMLHTWQNQPKVALPYYQRALSIARQLKSRREQTMELLFNNMAAAYIQLDKPQAAIAYSLNAIKMASAVGAVYNLAGYKVNLAEAYAKLSKWNMALYHAQKSYQISVQNKALPDLIKTSNLLDTLYAQQGNYRMARRYTARSRALEAKARLEEQQRKVADIQARYEAQQRERRIEQLRQQAQLAQLASRQQQTERNAAVLIAGLLLLAVGILYNRYRLRQRSARLLARQQQRTQRLLTEKTQLLQEVHHRVKNNLQLVLSLLSHQLDTLPETEAMAATALRDSQSRVQTMALLHQTLYQSDSLARIDMHRYLQELLTALARAFHPTTLTVQLNVAAVHLTPHTAVPLGLIVNELATNAYKYAGSQAQLCISLQPLDAVPDYYCLRVADTGPGLPASLDLEMVSSLGLRLAAGLARQLRAQLTMEPGAGAHFSLVFAELPLVEAPLQDGQPASRVGVPLDET